MFITFEGIDGSGKTSLAHDVRRILAEVLGTEVLLVDRRQPPHVGGYVEESLTKLQKCLWPSEPDEPQYLLGDSYFLLLTAAWLTALDEQIVIPAISRGETVLVDGWYFKLLSRNRLRPHVSSSLLSGALSHLSRPDLVALIDIAPEVAATRKRVIGNAEAGINDGYRDRTPESFVAYQAKIMARLCEELKDLNVLRIDGNQSLEISSRAVVEEISKALLAPQRSSQLSETRVRHRV